jgi:hypothetical protein
MPEEPRQCLIREFQSPDRHSAWNTTRLAIAVTSPFCAM